jgi:mRNA-degrading endonuclease RelE of RelBE toxin-antitoxin system
MSQERYRIICEVQNSELVIQIVRVAHRSNVY